MYAGGNTTHEALVFASSTQIQVVQNKNTDVVVYTICPNSNHLRDVCHRNTTHGALVFVCITQIQVVQNKKINTNVVIHCCLTDLSKFKPPA